MPIGLQSNQVNPEQTVNAMILGVHARTLIGNVNESLQESEAVNAIIDLGGTLTADVTLFLPDQNKLYYVRNSTSGSFSLTIKNAVGGTGVVIEQGKFTLVWCSAANNEVYALSAIAELPDPISAATINSSTINNATINDASFAGYKEALISPSISSGEVAFDMANGNFFSVSLTANVTSISFANVPATGVVPITIEFVQDATGGRTVTGWPAAVKWSGGSAPVITAAANAVDVLSGYTRNGGAAIRLDRAIEDSK